MAMWGMSFGAAMGDRVTVAPNTALDGLSAWTALVWCRPTTLGAGKLLVGKGVGSSSNIRLEIRTANASGALRVLLNYSTSSLQYDSANGLLATGQVSCVAVTFDNAASAGNKVVFHSSTKGGVLVKAGYAVQTDGVGSQNSDSGVSLIVGNNNGFTSAFQGSIFAVAVSGSVLTVGEMEAWRLNPDAPIRDERGRWLPGSDGPGGQVLDRSRYRAHGVVTGAKLSPYALPLVFPFARRGGDGTAPAASGFFARYYYDYAGLTA